MTYGLRTLLAPVEPSEFFARYWEQAPLYVARDDPDYFAGLFSLDRVDEILACLSRQSQGSRARLVMDGGWVPTEGDFDLVSVLRGICGGATLVIEAVERDSIEIVDLCRSLEESLGGRVAVNVYLTPADAQGFADHFDDHDVFVLQISGTKEWRVGGAPIRLPRPGMFDGSLVDDAPRQEIELRPGDALYLPRGFVHSARTGRGNSLHLTVGLQTVTWADVAEAALAEIATRDERFRHSVAGSLVGGTRPAPADAARFRDLLSALADHASLEDALRQLASRRPLASAPSVSDLLVP